jgi:hypothetical protein
VLDASSAPPHSPPHFHIPCLLASMLPACATLPRQLSTDQDRYAAALRALMRRAHSVDEIKSRLLQRGRKMFVDDEPMAAAQFPNRSVTSIHLHGLSCFFLA